MKINFNVNCEMEERWVPAFLKMLDSMTYCGQIGHSEFVGLFADGDKDFKPYFKYDIKFNAPKPLIIKNPSGQMTMYDAG